jgi:GNAT superfamily N-acetyltransferase
MRHESESISLRKVESVSDFAAQGFAELYRSAFGEPPYNEHYELDWILKNIWEPHIPYCIIVAEMVGVVVGLGCCHPLPLPISSVGHFILNEVPQELVPFPPDKTMYMSELAVAKGLRGKGIGGSIISARTVWAKEAGFTHYCMRTAKEGSNSRQMYMKMGAVEAPFTQNMSGGEVETDSSERIFLYSKL